MLFRYKAVKDNKKITKEIESDSEGTVTNYLRESGYFPIEIKRIKKTRISYLRIY